MMGKIVVLLSICIFFYTCTQPGIKNEEDKIKLIQETVNHTLDTLQKYCFMFSSPGIQEYLKIQLKGNYVFGNGLRLSIANQEVFKLEFEGEVEGDELYINFVSTIKNGTASTQTFEKWIIDENELEVIRAENKKQLFRRVNCDDADERNPKWYDSIGAFNEGFAVVSKNGRFGLVDQQWRMRIPTDYFDLGIVNEGSIYFMDPVNGLCGVLDTSNQVLIDPLYAQTLSYNEGLAAFLDENGLWGFMDRNGEVVIPSQYKSINFFKPDPYKMPFNEGLANVQNKEGFWNYINNRGEVIIQGDFLFSDAFENGRARVFKNNKWFYIDQQGNCIENCN